MPSPHEPHYLHLRVRRPGLWGTTRLVLLAGLACLVALLVERPATGLTVFWGLVVPALPLVFLLAPSVWRNVCPMATANQTPRRLGIGRARPLPPWLERHGYGVGIVLFFGLVALRPVLLDDSAAAVAVLLGAAIAVPFVSGLVFAGKSGFCGSICPLRPSQDVYARAPALNVAHAHCKPCVGCSSSCQDVKPATQLLENLRSDDPARRAYRRIFAGALPAVTVALFTAPPLAQIGLGAHFGLIVVAGLAGIGLLFVLESLLRVTAGQVHALFGAAAFAAFVWFNVPIVVAALDAVAGLTVPAWALWQARVGLLLLAARWLVRVWRDSGRRERATTPAHATAGATLPMLQTVQTLARPPGAAVVAGGPAVVAGEPRVAIPDRRGPDRPLRLPTVTLWPRGDQVEVEVETTIADAARAAGIELPEGCGAGLCGCDPVRVVSGAEHLSPAGDDERATLERLGLPTGTRLACSTRVTGDVVIDLHADAQDADAQDADTRDAVAQGADRRDAVVAPRHAAAVTRASVERVVVVGNGVAGITAAGHLRRLAPHARIHVITDSQRPFYNRIAISRLIHAQTPPELELLPERWYDAQRINHWLSTSVTSIDTAERHVVLDTGLALPYDKLILATGARALLPPIPNIHLPGVFGLRRADDALAIRAYVQERRCRRAIVVGGGLLGVEVADALTRLGVHSVIIERRAWLSNAEVDRRSATLLRDDLARRGVEVVLGETVTQLRGERRAEGVELVGGRHLDADIVIVCTGIAPNVELARGAGLRLDGGIVIDDAMRTSDPDVLACGDVARHEGTLSGRWPAAVEQAGVAAVTALGGHRPYVPGLIPTRLKVSGVTLNVVGAKEAGPGQEEFVETDRGTAGYRKLIVEDGRLAGALVYGDATGWDDLVVAVREQREVGSILGRLRAGDWGGLADRAA